MRPIASSSVLCAVLACLGGCATTAPAKPAATVSAGEPREHHMGREVDPAGAVKAFDHRPKAGEKAICAVSGEVFLVDADTQTTEFEGKYYAFCCEDCPKEFKTDPAKFAHAQ